MKSRKRKTTAPTELSARAQYVLINYGCNLEEEGLKEAALAFVRAVEGRKRWPRNCGKATMDELRVFAGLKPVHTGYVKAKRCPHCKMHITWKTWLTLRDFGIVID